MLITIVQHNHNFMEYNSPIIDQYERFDTWIDYDNILSFGFTDFLSYLDFVARLISKSLLFTKSINIIEHGISIQT